MPDTTRATILRHWQLANARQWDAFDALLAPDLHYEVPQTREYLDSAAGYSDLFRTWPGAWTAHVQQLVCERAQAVSIIDFEVDGQHMTGISVFELRDGLIARVTDHWPEPYEPPARTTSHLKRRPHAD